MDRIQEELPIPTPPFLGHNSRSSTLTSEYSPTLLNEKGVFNGKQDEASVVDIPLANTENTDIVYPSGVALVLLTLGLCMTTFVVALDSTIIVTAIPTISTVFHAVDDVAWYGSAYLLPTTSLQPLFGNIYTHFDIKFTYLVALFLFEAGSVLCAAASGSPMFCIGRAVAGAGAAGLVSGGMNIIALSVPMRRRPIFVAILSSMFGIASVVGPLLGGVLTDKVSWRWCFWINLPFGAAAFLAVLVFFKPPPRKASSLTFKEKIKEIDSIGAVLLISAIICLFLGLQWGGDKYPWSDSKVYDMIIAFTLLFIAFIYVQYKRGDKAMIPRMLFKQRTVLVCSMFTALSCMALYTHMFYLPFYFQTVKGTTAEGSGIHTIPYLVIITLSSLAIGAAITAVGHYAPFMWAGSVVFTVGCGMIYSFRVTSPPAQWIGYQLLAGIGAGSSLQIPFLAVQVVLDAKDMPVGNSVVMFFNSLGRAISVSIAQNIFSNSLPRELVKHAPGVDPTTVISAGATHLRNVVSADQLPGVLEAYSLALDQTFILPIAAAGSALLVSLFIERRSVSGNK